MKISKRTCSLLFVILILVLQCSRWSRDYSILDTSPYIDYGTNLMPELADGPTKTSFALGGNYVHTGTDVDTSVNTFAIKGVLKGRAFSAAEAGFTGTTTIVDRRTYFYGVLDGRLQLSESPVIISPDIGFGMGNGKAKWCFDLRISTLVGFPIVKNSLTFYAMPRLIALMYPWHAEGTELGTSSILYAWAPMYGIASGICFSVPLESKKNAPKLMVKPEINYLLGKEPELDQIDFSVLHVGCQVGIAF